VGLSLIAFDTDHIKQYVFGTDKLREIRGASSILDRLNRNQMDEAAKKVGAFCIYANGGSGLYLVDTNKAHEFGSSVQASYRSTTGVGASITYVVQDVPTNAPNDLDLLLEYPLNGTLELLRYRLREAKGNPPALLAAPSHPFMRPCDICGHEYAEKEVLHPDEAEAFYCAICWEKREEDKAIKEVIRDCIEDREGKLPTKLKSPLWERVIRRLREQDYLLPEDTDRPSDFNDFRNFSGAKEYFGLIYADGNSMGQRIEKLSTLKEIQEFAEAVDNATYEAVCMAIKAYLRVGQHINTNQEISWTVGSKEPIFPFDLLLLGGDDVVMVTPASIALDVSLTIANAFRDEMRKKFPNDGDKQVTLSIGVVLAPVKYPFKLLLEMAESSLKFAKKIGAELRFHPKNDNQNDDARINFLIVTGGTSPNFQLTYNSVYTVKDDGQGHEFYATLRPYEPAQLAVLLNTIREGRKLSLGRTKLHELREAVLQKNLTTSVTDALGILRNWRMRQREYVVRQVYEFGGRFQVPRHDQDDPASYFPKVTFPWFADGIDVYRTSLLDFVELYDFVSGEEGEGYDEH
jgi:hypothetical protein